MPMTGRRCCCDAMIARDHTSGRGEVPSVDDGARKVEISRYRDPDDPTSHGRSASRAPDRSISRATLPAHEDPGLRSAPSPAFEEMRAFNCVFAGTNAVWWVRFDELAFRKVRSAWNTNW